MNDTILIIANGPSALKKEYGSIIDTFSEVARINNYKITEYHNFIGNKTTLWFNGANKKIKIRKINTPKKTVVFVPYDILKIKEEEVIKRTPKRLGLDPEKYQLVSMEKMKQYEIDSNIKRPTTGFNSIMWSMENYKNVIIHGFDFFLNNKHHYYDSFLTKIKVNIGLTGRAKLHDNAAENKFVKQLIIANKIKTLKNYVQENHLIQLIDIINMSNL